MTKFHFGVNYPFNNNHQVCLYLVIRRRIIKILLDNSLVIWMCHTESSSTFSSSPFIYTSPSLIPPQTQGNYRPRPAPNKLLHSSYLMNVIAKAKSQILICLTLCLGDVYVRLGGLEMWFKDRAVFSKGAINNMGERTGMIPEGWTSKALMFLVHSLAAETILQSISYPLCDLSVVLLLFVYMLYHGIWCFV